MTLAFAAFQWQDWHADHDVLQRDQIALALRVGEEAASPDARGQQVNMDIAAAMARGNEETTDAAWFPAAGQPVRLVRSGNFAEPMAALGDTTPSAEYARGRLVVRAPIIHAGRRIGEAVLWAHDRQIAENLGRNNIIAIALAATATLVSAFVAGALARRGLRPLYALDHGIQKARRWRDFSTRVEVISSDEFGRLSENFNALLADLQTYDGRLQDTLTELTAARDQAEHANTLKSQFLANVSHEIRTPLNGVLGMAQVMSLGDLAQVQRDRLDVIQRSGAALLSLLNDILDLSKIEAGRLEIEAAPFDIEAETRTTADIFQPAADGKGLAFDVRLDESVRGQWLGDALRLRQLIQNLVSNALKFTSTGGVTLHLSTQGAGEDHSVVLTVTDTGIGIAADALEKVFENFTQADASTTRQFGGTGLGLAICRQIAELMGGTLEAASTLGKGSTFVARLPMRRIGDVPAQTAPAARPIADIGGLKVLAADDNATNQLLIQTLIEAIGGEPTIVADGLAAVEAWRTGKFDVVLMDIQMPTMDGMSATQEIRRLEAQEARAATPIYALSANAMSHQVEAYIEAGMDGHLAKPIMLAELIGTLEKVGAASALQRGGPAFTVKAGGM
ncbi:ATP-binding protein [Caulobacter sp. KR2-114]|uniref:ATP-binding protein n=1 Tax=Caulobacter sp. KR2-114 TaxID=3400912 RepID=UPI003C0E8FE8